MPYHGAGVRTAIAIPWRRTCSENGRQPGNGAIACGLHRSMTEAGIHLQQMLPLCNTRCCNSTSTNQALHLASNRDGHRLGEASCMKTAI